MSAPERIQLRRTKGWRMPPNTVKVDRSAKWGNPHRIGDTIIKFGGEKVVEIIDRATAEQAVEAFRWSLMRPNMEAARRHIREQLAGKNLACWCAPGSPCHADVLLELANAHTPTTASSTVPEDQQAGRPA